MSTAQERAREACDACRKSHKKCKYDDNSTRCDRCVKRDTACSLFPSAETAAVAHQSPPPLMVGGSTLDSWAALGTPHGSSASSNFSYPFSSQEDSYWNNAAAFTGNPQVDYPGDMNFQGPVSGSEQPVMNQDNLYGYNGMFSGP